MNRPSSFSGGMSGDLADTATILQGVPEGERDDTLFRWACRLRRQLGDGGRRIVELAVLDAASRCMPPFPPNEALRKVEQAWRQDHSDRVPDSRRLVAGGDFVLDEPETIPAVWGDGERVLWTEGEGVMITGHQGVGKTTVAQQLVLHRIGLRAGDSCGSR
jgi:hypothetical protein